MADIGRRNWATIHAARMLERLWHLASQLNPNVFLGLLTKRRVSDFLHEAQDPQRQDESVDSQLMVAANR